LRDVGGGGFDRSKRLRGPSNPRGEPFIDEREKLVAPAAQTMVGALE
jgi:hypothetical protein